uniref:Putative methyltransferase n=1 Tax=viral metagenome TaxID=1070528 RepID=A0A6M3KG82_9ZZZZ
MIQGLLIWFGVGLGYQEMQKRAAEAEALRLAKISGKSIINIGAKCNPFGDVRCDINPQCGAIKCDAENMSQFYDKEFSVALLSHIIEHLDNPDKALAEAERIADNVIIVTPSPLFPQTWLHPEHKWVYFGEDKRRIRD